MSNGFNYESPLNAFLSRGLPQIVSEISRKQERDKERESQDKWRLREWNENTRRYNENVRREEDRDKLNFDNLLIERGSKISSLQGRDNYYRNLLDSGKLRSDKGYDLLEGAMKTTGEHINIANDLVTGLDVYNLNEFELRQVENHYNSGDFNEGFNSLINIIDRKLKASPEQMMRAKNLSTERQKLAETLVDPLSATIYDATALEKMRGDKDRLDAEISEIFRGASIYKDTAGGNVESTDYGVFQINDKTWDKTSQKMFGKDTRRLTPRDNIKLASWIVKNSPRTVGGSTSGWNNWSVVLNDSYKQHMNKSDSYYMAGGLSKANLDLINKEFGDDAPIAKAVMMAESGGRHSAMNQNLSGGRSKIGKNILEHKPFEKGGEWNRIAIEEMSGALGISSQELRDKHGDYINKNFLMKYAGKDLNPSQAKSALESFKKDLVARSNIGTVKFKIPSGKHQGKKINIKIIEEMVNKRNKPDWRRKQKLGSVLYNITGGKRQYKWIDAFAKEIGYNTAEDLLLDKKEASRKINEYYRGATSATQKNKYEIIY
tara:strand:- start:6066 stop:7706 length:1641 start_codon:yes stop_codon:yes gene_type:complete